MDTYRNDYRHAQVSTLHVFLALSDERASSNLRKSLRTQFLVPNTIFQQKEVGVLEEMAVSRLRHRISKEILDHLVLPEIRNCSQITKQWGYVKWTQEPTERFPNGQN